MFCFGFGQQEVLAKILNYQGDIFQYSMATIADFFVGNMYFFHISSGFASYVIRL